MVRGAVPPRRYFLLGLLGCQLVSGWIALPAAGGSQKERPRQWVRELASATFSLRQRATQNLIESGLPALAAVEDGLESPDREVRLRCQRIRRVIMENDFQARLDRFLTDTNTDRDHGLPKWSSFRGFVGDSAVSRQLFVDMQREQGSFLDNIQRRPEPVPRLIAEGLQLLHGKRAGESRKSPSLATLATLLLLVLDRDIAQRKINDALTLYLFRLDTTLRVSPARAPLLALLRHWLPRLEGPTTYMAMHISLRHGVGEARVLAERALRSTARQGNGVRGQKSRRTYWRHLAVVVLARFGDESHVALLEPLLDDRTPTSYARRQGTQRAVTQIRDVALATLIRLRKRDLRDFGFRNVRPDPEQVWDLGMLAFSSDPDREQAIAAWRQLESQTP